MNDKEPTFFPTDFPSSLNDFTSADFERLRALAPSERVKFFATNYTPSKALDVVKTILAKYNTIETRFYSLWNDDFDHSDGTFSPFPIATIPDAAHEKDNQLTAFVGERLALYGVSYDKTSASSNRVDEQGYTYKEAFTSFYFALNNVDKNALLRMIEKAPDFWNGTPFVFVFLACVHCFNRR